MTKDQIESIIFEKMKADAVYRAAQKKVESNALLIVKKQYNNKIFSNNGIKYKAIKFLIDTYRTEIEKVLGVWAMFDDENLLVRPNATDHRGRNLLEQMVHQSVSENLWFSTMLAIHVTDNPLPEHESRLAFIRTYHRNATATIVFRSPTSMNAPSWPRLVAALSSDFFRL